MALINVLTDEHIEQFGQQLRGLLDGGYLSAEAGRVLDKLVQESRRSKVHVQGKLGKVEFELTFWAEAKPG